MEKSPIVAIDLIAENAEGKILLGKVSKKWQDNGKYLWGLPEARKTVKKKHAAIMLLIKSMKEYLPKQ